MTLEALYFVAQIIAAIAIIGSLVFVGFQIRANTREHRTTAYNIRSEKWVAINQLISSNTELWEAVIKGNRSYRDLTPSERMAYGAFWHQYCSYIFDVATQRDLGTIDETVWQNYQFSFRMFCRSPGARTWWREQGSKFFAPYPRGVLQDVFDSADRKPPGEGG